jgi:hypothetical protein
MAIDKGSKLRYFGAGMCRNARRRRRNHRLHRVFEELAALGIQAEPALYADDSVEDVRKRTVKPSEMRSAVGVSSPWSWNRLTEPVLQHCGQRRGSFHRSVSQVNSPSETL